MTESARIARLVSSRELGPGIRHFVFEVPDAERLDYQPGQFVSFTGDFDGKAITRAYSIASRPDGNRFELCLNLVPDGHFSPRLFAMQPGDAVSMKGPLGTFVLRQPMRDTVMVATGTGIAPFRGMVGQALADGVTEPITLIFGARHKSGLVFGEEFIALEEKYPNFRFLPALTRPAEDWTGRTGRVQPILLETIGTRTDLDVYACGLRAMTDDVRALLKERGFERRQIIVEKYD